MNRRTFRIWWVVHSWSSLICTIFLVMLCVTGMPLIFHDEIEAAFEESNWEPANPDGPLLSYDEVLETALANRPGEAPIYMSFDTDRPVVNVTSGPSADAPGSQMHFAPYDQTSGNVVVEPSTTHEVMDFILQLHTDMFLGLPGMLFLGAMGFLLFIALASGVVLYAPFMKKHDFGMVRKDKSPRLKWLDLHNLLGVATMLWLAVVGVTGVVNTLEQPINDVWRENALVDLKKDHEGQPLATDFASLDRAIAEAKAAAPGMTLQFVAFPGSDYSTDGHFAIFLHGDTPLTRHLTTPVLVDARTGQTAGLREMPWYSQALSLSRPLHFGDYGGLPLKIIWAILNAIALIVLGSGIYLWVKRRRWVM